MTNIFVKDGQQPTKESDIFTKTVIFILVLSAAIFVMPSIAIILIADAFAIGGGNAIAINMTIGAAVLAVILPFIFALSRRIAGPSAKSQLVLMQRDVALLQQDIVELRHQTLVTSESAEFSKQLLMSREKAPAEKPLA